MFAGPGLPDSSFGGILDHLVHFIRLIRGCKVQLPAFRLHFTWFKARFDHVFVFEGVLLDPGPGPGPVFISAEQSGAVFTCLAGAQSGALTGDTSILLCSPAVNLEEDCVIGKKKKVEWMSDMEREGERGGVK